MSTAQRKCNLCGKEKRQGFSGSLTQWVSLCFCDVYEPESKQFSSNPEEQKKNTIKICLDCGKRIGAGRTGTFTQWIFRSDICNCENPQPIARSIKALSDAEFKQAHLDSGNFIEIALEEANFPMQRFAPLEVINTNPNSTIYLAVDRLLGTRVAIKMVSEFNPDNLIRFHKEVRALASLTHPGLVKVLDFAENNGTPYMVMEFIDGISLGSLLKLKGRLNKTDSIAIVIALCEALSYCHSNKVLHRDIKPDNILICEGEQDFRLKLVDFGLASFANTTKVMTTKVAGTPLYMAPDTGKGLAYDERSDLYSVGCLLFELLTGEPPYNENNPLALLKKHAEAEIPIPSVRISNADDKKEVEESLDDLVVKCLAKSPDDRFQSIEELRSALTRIASLSHHPVTAEHKGVDEGAANERLDRDAFASTNKNMRSSSMPYFFIGLSLLGLVIVYELINLSRRAPVEEANILAPDVRNHLIKVDLSDEYPVDSWMSHNFALHFVRQDTRDLMFNGPDLTDEQVRWLATRKLFLERFGLNDCTSIKPESIEYFLSRIKMEEIFLGKANCSPAFIKALAPNIALESLRLKNATPECIRSIPENLEKLTKLEFIKSEVNGDFTKALAERKKFHRLETITFSQCRIDSGAMKQIKKLFPNTKVIVNQGEQ
ncbi:protein kinase [bacterium]|nr:protein kinase [bacterium]